MSQNTAKRHVSDKVKRRTSGSTFDSGVDNIHRAAVSRKCAMCSSAPKHHVADTRAAQRGAYPVHRVAFCTWQNVPFKSRYEPLDLI